MLGVWLAIGLASFVFLVNRHPHQAALDPVATQQSQQGSIGTPTSSRESSQTILEAAASTNASQAAGSTAPDSAADRALELNAQNTTDVWTTSVYSYSGAGGGPGGGKDDAELRVGGWGDLYVSLIRFPADKTTASRILLELYNSSGAQHPTPMTVNAIDQDWHFPRGERLWWSDKPSWSSIGIDVVTVPNEGWVRIDVTDWYRSVSTGQRANFGLALVPVSNDNRHDHFASSDSPDSSKRPRLVFQQ